MPGIEKKKTPKKMHITLGCINITKDEVEEAEMKFKRIGEKFTDMTSPGSFLLNLRGLEMGDGSEVLFVKVQLGKEILEILRGLGAYLLDSFRTNSLIPAFKRIQEELENLNSSDHWMIFVLILLSLWTVIGNLLFVWRLRRLAKKRFVIRAVPPI